MPNHVHLVVVPGRQDSLAKGVGRANNAYSRYLNQVRKRSGHLWQNRFCSAPLEREHLLRALRYVDLIRDLSIYPGKKMIVLFSRGHSMGFDTFQRSFTGLQDADLLERLRGESMRARISMYVVDASGLEVGAVSADNRFGMEKEVIFSQTQFQIGVPSFIQGQAPVTAGLMDGHRGSQQGLKVLAKMTHGAVVTDSNDLGEIFDHVKKDLGG